MYEVNIIEYVYIYNIYIYIIYIYIWIYMNICVQVMEVLSASAASGVPIAKRWFGEVVLQKNCHLQRGKSCIAVKDHHRRIRVEIQSGNIISRFQRKIRDILIFNSPLTHQENNISLTLKTNRTSIPVHLVHFPRQCLAARRPKAVA